MNGLRRHRQHLARLVAVVLLLAALAPAMSRGLAFVQDRLAPWAVLCSASSSQASEHLAGGSGASLLQHCPMCHLAGDAPALLPVQAPPLLRLPLQREGPPPLALQAPRPLHAWAAPPSQAPPLAA